MSKPGWPEVKSGRGILIMFRLITIYHHSIIRVFKSFSRSQKMLDIQVDTPGVVLRHKFVQGFKYITDPRSHLNRPWTQPEVPREAAGASLKHPISTKLHKRRGYINM